MVLLLVALVDCVNSKPTFLILEVMIDTQEFRWIHFYIETDYSRNLAWQSCSILSKSCQDCELTDY